MNWNNSRILIVRTRELFNDDMTRSFSGNEIRVIQNGIVIESKNVECIVHPNCSWKITIDWKSINKITEQFQQKYPALGVQNNPKCTGMNYSK